MIPNRFLPAAIFSARRPIPGVPAWSHEPQSIRWPAGFPRETPSHLGGRAVDDSPCLRYFQQPDGTFHRRYEALRAYFLQRRPLREIAAQYGYTYDSLRQVIHEFRCQCRSGSPPLCSRPRNTDVRPGTRPPDPSGLKSPTGDAWTSNRDDDCEVASRASSCSCRCWPASASINSSPKRVIPARP